MASGGSFVDCDDREEDGAGLKKFFLVANCLIVTLTHDVYLENGTYIGRIVGGLILTYAIWSASIQKKTFVCTR